VGNLNFLKRAKNKKTANKITNIENDNFINCAEIRPIIQQIIGIVKGNLKVEISFIIFLLF